MKIREVHENEVPVLEISGKLDGGADNIKLVTTVKELARAGEREIVVDMGRVRMITSTGLGMLMRSRNWLEREDGHLHLCALTPRSQELFYVTRTRGLFAVYESREEAVGSVRGSATPPP